MVVPNPDIISPKSEWEFGFTAGSMALIMEAALRLRYPGRDDLRFTHLGTAQRAHLPGGSAPGGEHGRGDGVTLPGPFSLQLRFPILLMAVVWSAGILPAQPVDAGWKPALHCPDQRFRKLL